MGVIGCSLFLDGPVLLERGNQSIYWREACCIFVFPWRAAFFEHTRVSEDQAINSFLGMRIEL